ncbi:PREDICTED: DNA excision repair protein ERCC-1 [Rhinopithecus bieti]|uniref:DNA excision repair protein ERCC-1 n=1 Tax=Rhinopithecus bieti TaxID=61621 RepID=UPI00083BDE84|nr:PREDICTED: DNA excision repair protein ERCC-1 [Rhinopithecus bieti]
MSLLPRTPRSSRTIESCIEIALLYALLSWGAGPERPEVRRALGSAGRAGGGLPQSLSNLSLEAPRPATELAALKPFQMDPGKDKEGVPQPSGPPARKKFVIPLDEDEIPPGVAKPLFKSTQSLPTVDTSAQAAPQTYAEYAISQPLGGAGATCPTGSEPLAGETPNQALKPGAKSNSIIVSPRQRGNPVLKFVRNVPWEFGDVIPDYVLGQSTCALFLSLRYHNLHPDYIHGRLQSLGKNFALRVLLIQVDVMESPLSPRLECSRCPVSCYPSPEEAGRYLETYKAYEQKPADLLMEKLEQDFVSRVTECLTTVKSVNKTDSQTLLATFGSLEQLIAASREDLALCPGLGPQKARRLFDVLHEPFLKVPR